MSTYMPACAPEEFTTCPILLTRPAEDRWSPLWMAETFLERITAGAAIGSRLVGRRAGL